MIVPGSLHIKDFTYDLPSEKIASYPLKQRDQSKLLVWKDNAIADDIFCNIDSYIPAKSRIVFNETRVFPSRFYFLKPTGAIIEIFCLEPVSPFSDVERIFAQQSSCVWRCIVGNVKKWKSGKLSWKNDENSDIRLFAELITREAETAIIRFAWQPEALTFSEIAEYCGKTPLPPYIRRPAEENDKQTYQTVYAREEGSVAAPTAGLHFTNAVLNKLQQKESELLKVVLHTGAGTFKPVLSETLSEHLMHAEKIQISLQTIQQLLLPVNGIRISVGTTTVRTLESLYWFGVKLLQNNTDMEFVIEQWEAYERETENRISMQESLNVVLQYMERNRLTQLNGVTRLLIAPGYRIRMSDALITNFHQPQSTLLLLVSAFIGDEWKKAYQYALSNNFRFLSYGDACLFFKKQEK